MVSGKPLYMTWRRAATSDSEQRSTHAQRNTAIQDVSQRSTATGLNGPYMIQRNTAMHDACTHTLFSNNFIHVTHTCDYVTP